MLVPCYTILNHIGLYLPAYAAVNVLLDERGGPTGARGMDAGRLCQHANRVLDGVPETYAIREHKRVRFWQPVQRTDLLRCSFDAALDWCILFLCPGSISPDQRKPRKSNDTTSRW